MQDSFDNPVRTAGVAVSLQRIWWKGDCGGRVRSRHSTDPNGVATFAVDIEQAGRYSLVASSACIARLGTAFTISAGPAATVEATGGTPQSAAVLTPFLQPLQATVRDGFSNPVGNVTVSFTAPASGATSTLSAASATTNASGQASVTATANNLAGSYTVSATAGGLTAVTFALTNVAGAAGLMGFAVQPSNTAAGSAISPAVIVGVSDTAGNAVIGATVTLQLQGGTGTLDGTDRTRAPMDTLFVGRSKQSEPIRWCRQGTRRVVRLTLRRRSRPSL